MLTRLLLTVLALTAVLPPQGTALRFHCLLTGARDLERCCCTGSATECCGAGEQGAEPECGT
ncbi:MAG: hypothetical protein HUU15_05340 [Candidatus Brocadiae bacterium]|nr:hypothetical protein [Candidatus Brocadiia bacterium]